MGLLAIDCFFPTNIIVTHASNASKFEDIYVVPNNINPII